MSLFTETECLLAQTFSELIYCNPFLPIRIELERRALGEAFDDVDLVWSGSGHDLIERANVVRLQAMAESLCEQCHDRLVGGTRCGAAEGRLYEDLVLYVMYYRLHDGLARVMHDPHRSREIGPMYDQLTSDLDRFLTVPGVRDVSAGEAGHLLACFFQIRRAFDQIFRTIVGVAIPSARLRASIWQSIFTHDMRRYRRLLYDKTGDFTTLVVGPSGTGKELVARAIGASRYIPFDARRRIFADDDIAGSFFPLNLSALSPTLIESELFGHRRGAFTGAVEDRKGWLELCPPLGTVFLDEIGELDPAIQVKLLRVLQTRTFQRLGDTRTHLFQGKIIAATNRDLHAEIARGGFRRDFYYRICSDIIVTPPLREQIGGSAEELRTLVRFIAQRLLPDEAETLANESLQNIERHLGDAYAWPGNFRELEQCVRNVLVHGEYLAPRLAEGESEGIADAFEAGTLTADELLSRYCTHMYRLTGSYEAAAKRLKLDRRTVRAKVTR